MKVFVVISAVLAIAVAQFKCPAENGRYEDSKQCDKYYDCIDGVATEKLCPDGLVFDTILRNRKTINRCDLPINVDCGERSLLQQPQPTSNCPRRNGLFPHPEIYICDVYYNCIDGESTEMTCSSGLHFDKGTGNCLWAAESGRQGCIESIMKTEDGFQCPREQIVDSRGQLIVHPKYAHATDCQKFYVCVNGVEPRALGCPHGLVYNEETQNCEAPENVKGCENWYEDSEEQKTP